MSRKWWASARTQQARAIRNTRRRLRLSYRTTLRRELLTLTAKLEREAAIHKRAETDRANIRIGQAEDEVARLSQAIMRLRLFWEPGRARRFTMQVQLNDRFIHEAPNLKELAGVVIQQLARRAQMEFAQIDFERVQPDLHDPQNPLYEIRPSLLKRETQTPNRGTEVKP